MCFSTCWGLDVASPCQTKNSCALFPGGHVPDGPIAECLRFLIPKTIQDLVLVPVTKYWVLGPFGCLVKSLSRVCGGAPPRLRHHS